jgi:hypothetical protein
MALTRLLKARWNRLRIWVRRKSGGTATLRSGEIERLDRLRNPRTTVRVKRRTSKMEFLDGLNLTEDSGDRFWRSTAALRQRKAALPAC